MNWPHATDYNAAVQNPQLCFRDDELRQGQAVGDLFGLPRPHSGNFADVYQIQGPDGQSWAVKCFTRPVAGLAPRYQAITEHLRQTQRAFMVDFRYLEEGICIAGHWYPLVKMRWVEGFRLNEFIRDQLDKPVVLERLGQLWLRLAGELRDARMAHGDLQHGNVLLVPSSKGSSLALKLIDYDGMCVPALADRPSGEVGHPNYQHPQRLREGGYHTEMDRFAHLLIYTALRCLRVGGLDLWQRYDNLENLLFREEDFRQPGQSTLLRELWELKDRDARYLVGHLLLASQGPLLVVPSLDELVDDSGIRPLSDSEEAQIEALLNAAPAKPKRARARVRAATDSSPEHKVDPPTAVLAAAPTVETNALADTQPISLKQRTAETRFSPHPVSLPLPPRPASPPPLPPSFEEGESHPQRRSFAEIDRDTHPPATDAGKPTSPTARLFDAAVSILSRPTWLAVLGVLALVSFLVVNVLVWSSVKSSTPPATTPRPTLTDIEDVHVKEGYKKQIHLRIARNDCPYPLTLRVEGLPDGMSAPPRTLEPDEDTASLTLLAPLGVTPRECAVHVSLWQGEDRIDEKRFRFSVQPVPRPVLDAPDNRTCPRGRSTTLRFRVRRNDCREPLTLRFQELPPDVRQESAPSADGDTLSVTLTVADKQRPGPLPVNLRLLLGDVVADSKPMLLTISDEPTPPVITTEAPRVRLKRDKVPDSLSIECGGKGELLVFLDRQGYREDVELRLEGLPDGASAEPITVAAALSFAKMTVETKADAEPGEYEARLLVRAREQTLDERTITLRLRRPRPRKEEVHFSTVDHVRLAGTLYHGWKSKKGMTVLMLHDLGHNRGSPGWKRLAETLQAEGHTVLTFDFRGHGDSKEVTKKFWEFPVNRFLLLDKEGRPLDPKSGRLDGSLLPGDYVPWLIEDIAAARTYLDLRHDEENGPVNTFNLVLLGAGRASALGSLWLATEGVRCNAADVNDKTVLKPPEKLSFLQAVWIGMDDRLNGRAFPVRDWVKMSHFNPVVPQTYVYGDLDDDTDRLLQVPQRECYVVPNARLRGQRLLDDDAEAARRIGNHLVAALKSLCPQPWVPRKIKTLHSYWAVPLKEPGASREMLRCYKAKNPKEEMLRAVPLECFGVTIRGLEPRTSFEPGVPGP